MEAWQRACAGVGLTAYQGAPLGVRAFDSFARLKRAIGRPAGSAQGSWYWGGVEDRELLVHGHDDRVQLTMRIDPPLFVGLSVRSRGALGEPAAEDARFEDLLEVNAYRPAYARQLLDEPALREAVLGLCQRGARVMFDDTKFSVECPRDSVDNLNAELVHMFGAARALDVAGGRLDLDDTNLTTLREHWQTLARRRGHDFDAARMVLSGVESTLRLEASVCSTPNGMSTEVAAHFPAPLELDWVVANRRSGLVEKTPVLRLGGRKTFQRLFVVSSASREAAEIEGLLSSALCDELAALEPHALGITIDEGTVTFEYSGARQRLEPLFDYACSVAARLFTARFPAVDVAAAV